MRILVVVAGALALALVVSSAARADSSADEADVRFRNGAALYRAGRFDDALAEFFASNRLAPNRNVVFNIARSYEALGRFEEAYRYYAGYRASEPAETERAALDRKLAELAPRVALLRIESSPPGATVFLDRRDLGGRGETPVVLAFRPGPHAVIVELPGHRPFHADVELVRGKEVALAPALELITGTVAVSSSPVGKVYVDRAAGVALTTDAPSAPAALRLAPGRHTIEIVADGHLTHRSDVVVRADATTTLTAELERRPPPSGTVVLQANVKGALVEVDGEARGFVPAVLALAVGEHEVVVRSETHLPWRRVVDVRKDGHQFVEAELIDREDEVVGATRAAQTVSSAPAAVTVMSREELRAFGYRTLTDALAAVRGIYASDDRNYETIGIRGFSRPGDYNNRVLLTRDGHAVNDDWIGSAAAGRDFAPDLEDVERIEVIRGPGSTFYGPGAFFGVINVVSRAAGDGPPVSAGGELDSAGGGLAFARGQAIGRAGSVVVSASAYGSDGGDLRIPEFADTPSGGVVRAADGEEAHRVAVQAHAGDFSLHGGFDRRRKDLPTGVYDTVFNPIDNAATGGIVTHTIDRRGFVEGGFGREVGRARVDARLAYDYQRYDGIYPYDDGAGEASLYADRGRGHWLTAETRLALRLPGQRLTVGAEGARHLVTQAYDEEHDGSYLGDDHDFFTGSLYALDEVALGARATLSAGLRFDRFGAQDDSALSPRLALVATPYAAGNTKLVLGRAFRSPSVYELFYDDDGITQVSPESLGLTLAAEHVWTGEIEHRHALGPRSYLLASAFASRITSLIELTETDDGLLLFANSTDKATSVGGELEVRLTATGGAWLSAALSASHLASEDVDVAVNSAPVVGAGRAYWPLASDLALAGQVVYNAPRPLRDDDGADTAHAVIADVFATQQLGSTALRLRAGVENLLDWDWDVAVGEEYLPRSIAQAGRTFVFQLRYEPR